MRFDPPPVAARFLRRYKRFLADVRLEDGSTVVAHVPNTGSLLGVARPDIDALVQPAHRPGRKLDWTLVALRPGRTWVGIHTQFAMHLAREAIEAGIVFDPRDFDSIRAEVPYGPNRRSRIDFLLERHTGGDLSHRIYVEVKNTTLVRDRPDGRTALFPDAPTARGRKHLADLVWAREHGHRAALIFTVQRSDCDAFAPAEDIDPAYAEGLRRAHAAGVEIHALAAHRVGPRGVRLSRTLPVRLA
ncbi:MAG: DNA/RNA nuclease SfsA [Deltaproteobacteria bacterium]|nr:MAG: DNA/RNA nuclease SfsA [Deltaproteobacteria bacterium]